MSYRVIRKELNYCILEINTDQIVFRSPNEINARSLCRNLNLGSGFMGFTPTFFCLEYTIKEEE